MLTYLTAPPAVSRKFLSSNHVCCILGAFSQGSPSLTILILIGAIPTSSHNLVKRINMDPLCCRPFLTFNDRASSMKSAGIWNSTRVETEEKERIPFSWFYWAFPRWEQKKKFVCQVVENVTG